MGGELDRMTWPQVRDAIDRGAAVLLTVASTEQHGPHLPLGTDALTGHEIAKCVAAELDLLVAPTLAYGARSRPFTGGGQRFPGTISLSGGALVGAVRDIVIELRRQGFRRIALMAHHMENQGFLYDAAYEAVGPLPTADVRVAVIEDPYPPFSAELMRDLYPDGPPAVGLDHAARLETALVLQHHPELVHRDLIVDDAPSRVPGYDLLPIPDGFTSASGVLSETTGATAELGERAMSEIVAHVRALIQEALFDSFPQAP